MGNIMRLFFDYYSYFCRSVKSTINMDLLKKEFYRMENALKVAF